MTVVPVAMLSFDRTLVFIAGAGHRHEEDRGEAHGQGAQGHGGRGGPGIPGYSHKNNKKIFTIGFCF